MLRYDQLKIVLKSLEGIPVLTTGEMDGFVAKGGMIRFLTKGKKIKLEINNRKAKEAKLKISEKLLKSASVVK